MIPGDARAQVWLQCWKDCWLPGRLCEGETESGKSVCSANTYVSLHTPVGIFNSAAFSSSCRSLMSRLQDVSCLEEKPLDSGLAGTGALSAKNLKQRCRTKKTKMIDAALFQHFQRFTVGYAFHQFTSASFCSSLGATFRLHFFAWLPEYLISTKLRFLALTNDIDQHACKVITASISLAFSGAICEFVPPSRNCATLARL